MGKPTVTPGGRYTILRPVREPRLKAIPDDEALDIAKKAFHEARRAQLALLAQGTNQLLFETGPVGYSRLRMLRGAARDQVRKAQRVNQLIDDAIEAFEATAPPASNS